MYNKNLKFLDYSNLEVSLFILIVSTLGSFMQISGASWDITSHLLNQPDSFFTPSHAMLYTGIGLLAISAGVGSYRLRKKKIKQYNSSISLSFKLLIIGSFLSLIAGPLDYFWHQSFGLDGLLSPTHITLATGMLVNSVAVFIGLYGVMNNISHRKNLAKIFLIPSLCSLWFTSIWYVFIFVLPFSESDFFNFNLDTYSATLIASIFLPLINSIMFLCSSKVFNNTFGYASIIVSLLVLVNTLSTILPTGDILSPLIPWYLVSILGASILADILLNSNFIRINTKQFKNNKLIASSIIGSIFYFFNYPMIIWTYGTFLNTDLGSLNAVLPTFLNTIVTVTLITVPVGAVMGLIGYLIFSKMIENSLNALIKGRNSTIMKSDY
ncbi:MAG TPA: hypothetical protein VFY77_06985 [Nitrososphaeraceae archaeon]|nr:hypothetical protein [Nitrososphaeraceae archaeon]